VKIQSSAPSNIALIKYMGKTDSTNNRPTNSSLSFTLDNLRTFVEITPLDSERDQWEALAGEDLLPVELSEKGRARFLAHFAFLKLEWGLEGHYQIRSASNFPSDCGLASSASSFAALTLATARLAEEKGREVPDVFIFVSFDDGSLGDVGTGGHSSGGISDATLGSCGGRR